MAKFGIGQAVRRVEDQRFLLGQGRYVDDISLPGQCYGVTVLSPHAHARIKRIDVAKAKAAPGVLCVLTGVDAVAGVQRRVNAGHRVDRRGRVDQHRRNSRVCPAQRRPVSNRMSSQPSLS